MWAGLFRAENIEEVVDTLDTWELQYFLELAMKENGNSPLLLEVKRVLDLKE